MAEIKQNFSAGKMNKDLDERLLPKGQYRHAENIQVSTSEDSDVGAIENILSNTKLSNINLEEAVCVGVYANEKENDLYWFVSSPSKDMILRYKNSEVKPVLVDVNKNVLKFEPGNIITGINVIDDLLFWTDNKSEPKKINLDFCFKGTENENTQTKLIVPGRDIVLESGVDIREEHITVIKKAPIKKITLDMSGDFNVSGQVLGFNFTQPNPADNNPLLVGDFVEIINMDLVETSNFNAGDILYFSDIVSAEVLPAGFEIIARVIKNISGTILPPPLTDLDLSGVVAPKNSYRIEIIQTNKNIITVDWNIYKEANVIEFFEKDFSRFSYRYKYRDGEYSTFAPFSDPAFLPGVFDYETKNAYNLGMQNSLSSLKLENFINQDILENVVQVDLLYKKSNSPNVYIVEKLKYKDTKSITVPTGSFNQTESVNNWIANFYEIQSDTIYASIPSNQLLRPYDNVPKKALAQEITGNRIVYANYTQNYNLDTKPIVDVSLIERSGISSTTNSAQKSLKSSRNYQLGIVYLDEYGRQTPVFSSSRSSLKVPKEKANKYNSIEFSAVTDYPEWASSYKIFVKETSNEYYNLAMDRVYKAQDGNLWLSFPSSERNKVDEETFLILKKEIGGNSQVPENLKYKIIAIENEAPVEVKRNNIFLADSNGGGTIADLFPNDDKTPKVGFIDFQISESIWKLDGGPSIDNISENLYIAFKDANENILSDYYEVASVEYRSPNYNIKLSEKISSKDSWIYSDVAATTLTAADLNVNLTLRFYKEKTTEQPEFDGKFFVKILNDAATTKYVLQGSEDTNNFVSNAYMPAFYVADTGAEYSGDWGNSLLSLSDFSSSQTQLYADVGYQADSRGDWVNNVLHFDQSSPSSSWFIDQAYYKAKHPGNKKLKDTVDKVQSVDPNYVTVTGNTFWYDNVEYFDSTQKPEYDGGFGKGVYQDNSGQWYMELSFSRILPDARAKQNFSSISFSGSDIGARYNFSNTSITVTPLESSTLWSIGSPSNPSHSEESDVVKNLRKNGIFKFVGDSNNIKYIINSEVVVEKRYNFRSFADVLNVYDKEFKKAFYTSNSFHQGNASKSVVTTLANSTQLEDVWDEFSEAVNRRLTYIIPFAVFDETPEYNSDGEPQYFLDTPLNQSSFSFGSNFLDTTDGADNNTPFALQFLEKSRSEENQLTSSNPAIWETEPKENIDLDIYYEASESYDISLHGTNQELDWFNCYSFGNGVESNRLRDDFNQVIIDKGAIASSTIDFVYEEENRKNGLIYSGVYNSITGVNNLNQFIQAEKITKDLNPTYGSIQKLFSRNTDLITFCEDKVVKVLANKDAVFNADGNPQLIASQNVLGQTIPFVGDYGISKNPESFAKESYRAYFTDKNRGKVLRLSRDGITPISDYGLSKYFKDNLKNQDKLIGSYDQKKNEYNLSLKFETISYDEKVKGWSSFKSYVPEQGSSVSNFYYTFKNGNLYKHHDDYALGLEVTWNNFYGVQYESRVITILNDSPSDIKSFKTVNYEGSQSNVIANLNDSNYHNLYQKNGWKLEKITTDKETGFVPEFIEKEGKWFNNVKGESIKTKQKIDASSFSFQGVGIASSTQFLLVPKPVRVFVEIYKIANVDSWFRKNNNQQQLFGKSDFNDTNEPGNNLLNPNVVVEEIVGGNVYRHGEPVEEIVQFKIRGGIDISQPAEQRPDGTYRPRPPIPIAASEFTLRHLDPPGNDGERSRAFDADGVVLGAIAVNNGAGGAVEDLGTQESTIRNEANINTNVSGPGFLGSTFSPISANVNFIDTGVPGESGNTVLVNVPIKFIIPSDVEQMESIKIELFLEQNSNNI